MTTHRQPCSVVSRAVLLCLLAPILAVLGVMGPRDSTVGVPAPNAPAATSTPTPAQPIPGPAVPSSAVAVTPIG